VVVRDKNEDREGKTQLNVFYLDYNNKSVREASILLKEQLIGDPYITFDNLNPGLAIAGFYTDSERRVKRASNGFFFTRFDPQNLQPTLENYEPYSGEFMVKLTGKEKNREDRSLYTFKIRQLILRADGGGVVVAESFYRDSEEVRLTDGLMNSQFSDYKVINVYHYNDIVTFSINPSGKIDWTSILRKRQLSENDNGAFSSYALFNNRSQLHFIYMEEIFSRSPINFYTVDHTGAFDRELLLQQADLNVMLIPKLGKQVSPSELIIPSFKKNSLKLVKVNF
jgi:hypothetical protein